MQKNSYHWMLYDVNIIRCRKNSYHWMLYDVNIIRCRKTAIIECCMMLISSDAEKQTHRPVSYEPTHCMRAEPAQTSWLCSCAPPLSTVLFCLMLISSDAEKHIFEVCLMLISSDVEKETDIVEVDHLQMWALCSWFHDVHGWFMLIPKSLTVISRHSQN